MKSKLKGENMTESRAVELLNGAMDGKWIITRSECVTILKEINRLQTDVIKYKAGADELQRLKDFKESIRAR